MVTIKDVISEISGMNLPLIESPFLEHLIEASDLDEKDRTMVRAFARDGYLITDTGLSDFDAVADRIIADLSNRYPPGERRIAEAWYLNEDVRRIASSEKIAHQLEVLYGRKAVPFQTLNFKVGTEQHTHSDAIHFYSIPHRFMCGVWVALEDVDADNGPLHYYPGSHKLRDYFMHDLGLPSDAEHYGMYETFVGLLMEAAGLEKVEVTLKKGQALIWAANLFHGGSPIRDTSRTRHSQVTHYYFENCMHYMPLTSNPYTGEICMREVIDIRTASFVTPSYAGRPVDFKRAKTVWRYPRPLPGFVKGSPAAG